MIRCSHGQIKRPPEDTLHGASSSDAIVISVFLQKLLYHFCAVAVDADRLFFDLHRAISLVEIQAGIDGLRVVIRHLPERIFANDRRSHSYADFQIKDMQLVMPSLEIGVNGMNSPKDAIS